jgi:hypothetical protein
MPSSMAILLSLPMCFLPHLSRIAGSFPAGSDGTAQMIPGERAGGGIVPAGRCHVLPQFGCRTERNGCCYLKFNSPFIF